MKRTIDYTRLNNDTPAVYPSGTPQNDSAEGAGDGTLMNEVFTNDVFNLFWKWVRETGVIPSGNFDNETNGYQLDQAFRRATNNAKTRKLINQTAGDDTEYTIEKDVDIVLIGAYASGTPEIIFPSDTYMKGKTVRLLHNTGNGSVLMNGLTGLTLAPSETAITYVSWCDVHYDGNEWRLSGWGKNTFA